MPALLELQADFAAALYGQGASKYVRGDGLSRAARMDIYRNNVMSNYLRALEAVYPVLLALTGSAWFAQTARAYIARTPSSSGDIHPYGADFATDLAELDSVHTHPYLADVARLEWLVHSVFHAADSVPLYAAQLAAVAPTDQPRLQFQLHPACRLLHSAYPVQRIWAVNQPGYSGSTDVSLDEGGVQLLVQRQGSNILLIPLQDAEFQLLTQIAQGHCLDEILDVIAPDQFTSALVSCFSHDCFTAYTLKPGKS